MKCLVGVPMKLRSHLLILTLGTLLPMLLFALIAVGLLAERDRRTVQRSAKEVTLALITAVDAEVGRTITTLQALATAPALDQSALREFQAEAKRVLPTQPGWLSISVLSPRGDVLLQTAREDKPPFAFRAAVPVMRAGQVRSMLMAEVDPQRVRALLDKQRLPADWMGEVIDGEGRVVARSSGARAVGQAAAENLRAALQASSEGWFHRTSLEGTSVYTAYHRSGSSGWSVAISIPEATVRAGLGRAAVTMTTGVIVALVAALLLAAALGQRIAAPIGALAATARALASGKRVEMPPPGKVEELRDVSRALADAVDAVRAREAALRNADRAKDEFLAMLSHELRNPLGALAAAAHVLRNGGGRSETAASATGVIERQVRHMTRLVEDLLDVSRVTRGKISLARQPIDLAQAARTAVQEMQASGRLDEHRVSLQLAPAWIHADEARIEQIVTNLVGNAAKYTAPGGGITVSVRRERDTALLQVRDTGMGMSAELASRVFDLFVQGERPLDRPAGGLGIGLTLVRRLAELHGGTAHAASAGPGQGSVFTVALPTTEARPPQGVKAATDPVARQRRKILVIEDSEDARRTLSLALRMDGHEVYEAADGPAGVDAAASVQPEVALIDIGLPGLNGYQVAERLRDMPERSSMVLIALTGYGQSEAFRRAHDAGFDDHVTKPVAPAELLRLIDAACALKTRRAGARPSA
jgi:signal transduction histidine kinase/ActR/RegA family two-component response regulator